MEKIRVQLEKKYIGYTLAEDVLKEKEVKLLGKNIVITDKLYELLKRHRIRHIYVYEK